MKTNAELQNDGISTIWRDLTTEPVWKYEESPPFSLSQLTKLDLCEASDSELARAIWFWCRRPKLMFHDRTAPMIVASCVLVSLFIGLFNWPGTSLPERITELIILLSEVAVGVCLVTQRIRYVRWRRDYESSIDRIIRNVHPGV